MGCSAAAAQVLHGRLDVLPWQAVHEIQIDIVKASLPRLLDSARYVFDRVNATERLQHAASKLCAPIDKRLMPASR